MIKKTEANDIPQQTVSVSTPPNVDAFNHFDDEKNLTKLAEKISSINKEKRDALEILEKVDSFYSKSFGSLLTLIISMIGFVGFFIPLGISYYQSRLLKKQNINLRRSIDNDVVIKLSELKHSLYDYNKNEMLKLEVDLKGVIKGIESQNKIEIRKLRAESLARINHLSAATCHLNRDFDTGAVFYLNAGLNYIQCEDHRGLKTVINSLLKDVFANIPSDDVNTLLDGAYDKFMKKLSSFDVELIYHNDIVELESAWRGFKKRAGVKNHD
ncbi:hypothetical protein B7L51_005755 [Pectobacterium brasiliense]|uniref:hypothetical protein n=1 Tax=Pectobacterium brasiliense TaxID=180957 RepID=UPI001F2F17B8|nr:hypothetical protein [Pectobacterium carotovorum]